MIRRVQVLQPEELIGTIEDFTKQMPELYQCVLHAMNNPMKSYYPKFSRKEAFELLENKDTPVKFCFDRVMKKFVFFFEDEENARSVMVVLDEACESSFLDKLKETFMACGVMV